MLRRNLRISSFTIVIALAAAMLAGCGVVGGSSSTATPTNTATAEPTSTPTRTATPKPTETPAATLTPEPATSTPEPEAAVPPLAPSAPSQAAPPAQPAPAGRVLPRGGTIVLRVPKDGAWGARALFRGDNFPMIDGGDEFWVPVGAGAAAALGDFTVTYTRYNEDGEAIGTSSEIVSVTYTEYPVEYITLPPGQLEGFTPEGVQQEINIRASTFAVFTPQKLWSGPFILPIAGVESGGFGDARSFNGGPVGGNHSGEDFAAPEGAPIAAAAAGRVAFAGFLATRGNSVIIDHGVGVFTAYHHMSRIDVAQGQDLAQGQQVGAVGSTGLSTGPHLHWELVVGRVNVDPVMWTFAGVAP